MGNERVTRFTADGSPDPTFGDGGAVALSQYPAATILPDDDGGVSLFGPVGAAYAGRRLTSSGARDRDFGRRVDANAFVSPAPRYTTVGYPVASASIPGGPITITGVAGTASAPRRLDGFVARFTPLGTIDRTFSGDGWRAIDFGGFDVLTDLAVLPDRRIVVVGWRAAGPGSAPNAVILAMLRPNGGLVASFGAGGTRVTRKRGDRSVALAADVVVDGDRALVAGGAGGDFLAVRYLLGVSGPGTLSPARVSGAPSSGGPRWGSRSCRRAWTRCARRSARRRPVQEPR